LCRVLVLEGREFCIIINLACSFRPSSIHQHLRPPHSIVYIMSSSSIAIKFSCRSQANYNARWSLSLARPQGGLQKFLESRNSLSLLKGSCLSSMCACVSRAVPTFFIFTAYSYTRYTEKSCFGFYTLEKSPAGGYMCIYMVYLCIVEENVRHLCAGRAMQVDVFTTSPRGIANVFSTPTFFLERQMSRAYI
jgi:hypothetical protein